MTAVATAPAERGTMPTGRVRPGEIWRIVRLLAVNPTIFFGIPWMILGGAWVITMLIALILRASGISDAEDGFRYSWAVLSPQWYLVVVGVQAVAYTLSFALGFGSTRRDYWLGMSLMFLFVSTEMAVAIATLVQVEIATDGWFIGAGMFDALWYGQSGWWFDFFTTFSLQLFVLFIGAGITTVYMRWRMRGMMTLLFSVLAVVLVFVATVMLTGSGPELASWLATIGIGGVFGIVLALAVVSGLAGYFVVRRATPR